MSSGTLHAALRQLTRLDETSVLILLPIARSRATNPEARGTCGVLPRNQRPVADFEKGFPHRFAEVIAAVCNRPGVTLGQPGTRNTFGHSALKIHDKIFALISSEADFVVKLPRDRVDELEAAGAGRRFEASNGSPMKEWFAVTASSDQDWAELALEALLFVRTVA